MMDDDILKLLSKAHHEPLTQRARLRCLSDAFPVGAKVRSKTNPSLSLTVVQGDAEGRSGTVGGNPSEFCGSAYKARSASIPTNFIATVDDTTLCRNGFPAYDLVVVEKPLAVGDYAVLIDAAPNVRGTVVGDTVRILESESDNVLAKRVKRGLFSSATSDEGPSLFFPRSVLRKTTFEPKPPPPPLGVYQYLSLTQIEEIKREARAEGARQASERLDRHIAAAKEQGREEVRAAVRRAIGPDTSGWPGV